MYVTDIQSAILHRIQSGHVLKANFEVEDGEWRPASFVWLYVPVNLSLTAHSDLVTAEDVQCLEQQGLIAVDCLEKGGLAGTDERTWRNWTANYILTPAGKGMVKSLT